MATEGWAKYQGFQESPLPGLATQLTPLVPCPWLANIDREVRRALMIRPLRRRPDVPGSYFHDSSEFKERDLVNALAFWAKETQGNFPANIDDLIDPNMIKPLLVQYFDKDGEPTEEMEQAMVLLIHT